MSLKLKTMLIDTINISRSKTPSESTYVSQTDVKYTCTVVEDPQTLFLNADLVVNTADNAMKIEAHVICQFETEELLTNDEAIALLNDEGRVMLYNEFVTAINSSRDSLHLNFPTLPLY